MTMHKKSLAHKPIGHTVAARRVELAPAQPLPSSFSQSPLNVLLRPTAEHAPPPLKPGEPGWEGGGATGETSRKGGVTADGAPARRWGNGAVVRRRCSADRVAVPTPDGLTHAAPTLHGTCPRCTPAVPALRSACPSTPAAASPQRPAALAAPVHPQRLPLLPHTYRLPVCGVYVWLCVLWQKSRVSLMG
ncbi:hypothetical protein E2562_006402 [Oryza meyeriana var. granulata]|uniref:Uncharacterized protein n=1 Tax=Oryza meyeriana var. granulata TaxID=110450 RepID=A0A6G1EFF2_9ORYZ|nr:hypothetical protein E2562_006402 [Oryza meyeriana var. granulata]